MIMAVIHATTMDPGKLALLAGWLPAQPWYDGSAGAPRLAVSGGFRLDDPEGAVGMEFMFVTDAAGAEPRTYQVPLTYRGAPLGGAEHALVGTSEHGVLGKRWIYDGVRDPVLGAELLALLQGRARPQHQNASDTPDDSVVVVGAAGDGADAAPPPWPVTDGRDASGVHAGPYTLTLLRVLGPESAAARDADASVTGGWRTPDGAERRGPLALLHRTPTRP
ncbi:hypothetical protein GCM10023347_37870 [Streptomyces chumphonensis]